MKKILMSLATVLVMGAVATAGTFAWFTGQDTSSDNVFQAGTLSIDVQQTGDPSPISVPLASNWEPGDTADIEYTVANTGTNPVQLKGFAMGSWTIAPNAPGADPTVLDNTMVKATSVYYSVDGGTHWTLMVTNPTGLTGEYYYSHDGTSGTSGGNIMTVGASGQVMFKITVVFDTSADNNYQDATYVAQVHMAARQDDPAASWPASY